MLVVKDGNFVKCVNFLRRCITFTQSFGNLTHAWCNVSLKMLRFDTFTFSKKVYKSNNIEWLELLYMLCQCQRLNVMYVSEVLWCSVMYCGIDVLCCAAICCDVLWCTVMCCDVLCCDVLWCTVLWCMYQWCREATLKRRGLDWLFERKTSFFFFEHFRFSSSGFLLPL